MTSYFNRLKFFESVDCNFAIENIHNKFGMTVKLFSPKAAKLSIAFYFLKLDSPKIQLLLSKHF